MISFALKIILAHLLGDFVLQPNSWVAHKRQYKIKSSRLYYHMGIHLLALLLLLEFEKQYWIGITFLVISHYLIDLAKIYLESTFKKNLLFMLDQMAHFLVIGVVVYSYFPFDINLQFLLDPVLLLFTISILIVTSVGAIVMRLLMSRWTLPEDPPENSLPKAGKYIGMLERLLVFIFIVLQQWPAIGWLIAAKSILRFSDLSRAKDRKLTEYVLIGTLLSFSLAIVTGLIYTLISLKI